MDDGELIKNIIQKRFYRMLFNIESTPQLLCNKVNVFNIRDFTGGYSYAVLDQQQYFIRFDWRFSYHISSEYPEDNSVLGWPWHFYDKTDREKLLSARKRNAGTIPEKYKGDFWEILDSKKHADAVSSFFRELTQFLEKEDSMQDVVKIRFGERREAFQPHADSHSDEAIEDTFLLTLRKIQKCCGMFLGTFTVNNLLQFINGYEAGVNDLSGCRLQFQDEFSRFFHKCFRPEHVEENAHWSKILYLSEDPFAMFNQAVEMFLINKRKLDIMNMVTDRDDVIALSSFMPE